MATPKLLGTWAPIGVGDLAMNERKFTIIKLQPGHSIQFHFQVTKSPKPMHYHNIGLVITIPCPTIRYI